MGNWIKQSWAEIRHDPLGTLKDLFTYAAVILAAIAAIGSYKNSTDIKQISHESIQRQCEMAFANGQAIIKTASRNERPSPEVIEAYRKNIEDGANEVLNKYDIDFHCEIPPIVAEGKER